MEGDVRYETWWNGLAQEVRTNVLQLIPTMGATQQAIFSSRLWHELHAWLRVEIRKVHEKLMDGYRIGDPGLTAMLKELGVLAIHPEGERALAEWEGEGGK
jgi:hypothetical protein